MKSLQFCIGPALALAYVFTAPCAQASVIVQYTAGVDPPSLSDFFGQSFLTPSSGGGWNSITFNFYSDDPGTTPTAAGTAFLLSSEYLGTAANLSSSTPGFIAQSTGISGGKYVFSPSVALSQNTEYWVYENSAINITGNSTAGGTPTEHAYISFSSSANFTSLNSTLTNFTVSGVTTTAPEPTTAGLAGAALVGLAWSARRKSRAS